MKADLRPHRRGLFVLLAAGLLALSVISPVSGSLAQDPGLTPTTFDSACAGTLAEEGKFRGGVVVKFDDSREQVFCVVFTGDSEEEPTSTSGLRALRLTGLDIVTATHPDFGELICSIDAVGTDLANCPASDNSFWGYFHADEDGIWSFAESGASTSRFENGSVDGWEFTPATTDDAGDESAETTEFPLVLVIAIGGGVIVLILVVAAIRKGSKNSATG